MRKLILLLLIPGLLWAQVEKKISSTLTVRQSFEAVKQEPGTIRSVQLGTANSMTFYLGKVGSKQRITVISPGQPLNYDSAGTGKWVPIDLSEKPARTKGFQKAVQIGPSFIEYDSLGNMRYEKGELSFEVKPLFKGVSVVFEPMPTMMKATYFIEEKGPDSLSWALTDPHRLAARKIPPFTALDAAGKPVALIETRTATSLSVRIKDRTGITWPVAIDPTVRDTSDVYTTNSRYFDISNANWATAHGVTSSTANALSVGLQAGAWYYNGNYTIRRSALVWPLTGISGSVVDSAYFTSSIQAGYPIDDSVRVVFVEGTFSGAPADSWVNDYTTTEWTERSKVLEGASVAYSVANSAGRAAILAALGDTLRTFMLEANYDLIDSAPAAGSQYGYLYYGPANIKLVVFTSPGNPPGLSTTETDSIKFVRMQLYGEVDSTGGVNLTARGFQYYLIGNTLDTMEVTESGSFSVGAFSLLSDTLKADTSYAVRAKGTGPGGTSYGDWYTVSTSVTGGGTLIVGGRTVDTYLRR